MSGFTIEPAFLGHRRFEQAGAAAKLLWVTCGVWAANEENGGIVPLAIVKLYGRVADARRLVEAGLWEEYEEGFRFLRWRGHMGSPETTAAERKRERDREYQRSRRAARTGDVSPVVDSSDQSHDSRTTVVRQEPGVDTALVQEVPPLPPHGGEQRKPTAAQKRDERGERIPEPFKVTREMREWAAREIPDVDVDMATRKFVDYWRALPGVRAKKLDWVATWRNSLRDDPLRGRARGTTTTKPDLRPMKKFT